LELLLLEPGYLAQIESAIDPAAITSPAAREIYDACRRLAATGEPPELGRLMVQFDDVDMKSLVVQLDESSAAKSSTDHERRLQDLVHAYEQRLEEDRRRKTLAAAQQDEASAPESLADFCQQSHSKHLREYERRKK